MSSSNDRLLALRHKIQDPGYLNTAISEMAQKLAREIYPYFYQSSPKLHEIHEEPAGQEFGQLPN